MTFRPLLCIMIDEETELRVYEERNARYDHYVDMIIYGLFARVWQG